jgi:hypothetical protein
MYSSLILGKLAILAGLYLFIINSDKTTGRFVIIMGLSSVAIGLLLFFLFKKTQPKNLAAQIAP